MSCRVRLSYLANGCGAVNAMLDVYLRCHIIHVVHRLLSERDADLGCDVCFRVKVYWNDAERAHRSDSASLSSFLTFTVYLSQIF